LGLEARLGAGAANVLQAGIGTMAHLGKPPVELLAAFPASLLFGLIALRTRSIWYALAIHWAVGLALDWFLVR
jgi:membrane protease YdiL (CAAX protease family)